MKIFKFLLLIFVSWLGFVFSYLIGVLFVCMTGGIFYDVFGSKAAFPDAPESVKRTFDTVFFLVFLAIIIFGTVLTFIKMKKIIFKGNNNVRP